MSVDCRIAAGTCDELALTRFESYCRQGATVGSDIGGTALGGALATLDGLLDSIGHRLGHLFWWSEEVRRTWAILDLVLAVTRGLLADRVVDDASLDELDDQEFRSWLVRHGATAEAVEGPFVRAVVYDLAFAYVGGSASSQNAAPGPRIRGLHRTLFTYRGALMWKLNGGMGDVVFMPLYELLVKRGVEFEFFHQVTDLIVKRGRITAFEYRQQAAKPDLKANLVCVDAGDPMAAAGAGRRIRRKSRETPRRQRRRRGSWRAPGGADDGVASACDVENDIVVLGISWVRCRSSPVE